VRPRNLGAVYPPTVRWQVEALFAGPVHCTNIRDTLAEGRLQDLPVIVVFDDAPRSPAQTKVAALLLGLLA
jgi:hypothetical protein